jgi:hypothetical protein
LVLEEEELDLESSSSSWQVGKSVLMLEGEEAVGWAKASELKASELELVYSYLMEKPVVC